MTANTISDAVTMTGGEGTLLANRYRIVRQLGQGGMGSVWLAEDTQLDNKPFAIKMLPSILVSNKRAYRQLKDEALVAMRLVHPNIVQIRAFEENNGNPFLVMDYIDGQSLDDCLEEWGTLTPGQTVTLLRPVAAALDYAHRQGVVHRDVKPGNVMVRKDGVPFVLDFGIAREIQETMTRVTGKFSSGTLLYMSPEQLNGDAPRPAQDIYSFAAMAYECLKGEPPFSHGQIEFQIMNKMPEPLPVEPLTGEAAILAAGVMSGLAKKPEDRPATCLAVLDGKGLGRVERADGANKTDAPRASVRVHPPNASLNHPAAMAGDSSFPQTQKGRSKTGIGIAVGILALFASLGVGGLWLMLGRTEASDVVMTPDPAKVSADAIFSEARSNMAACTRLDLGDGFKERVEECQSSLDNAKVQYDLGHWSVAAQAFTNVSEKCHALIAADVERDNAKTAASLLSESIKAAEDAEAQKFAKSRFESATKTADRGHAEFGDFKFAAAAATYEQAKGLFDLAAQEAGKSKQEETEAAERSEAAKIRAEAIVQRGKVERISDADGFKSRKDSLEDVFIRAEAFYDENAKRWDDAVPLYKSYVEQSKALIALDEDRSQAVAKRDEVQTSFKEAEQAGAKIYAKDSWNAAVKTWNAATAEFRRMEFVSAVETFAKALREFDGCAEEARISAEKQATEKRLAEAREAEERRRAELARQEDARRRQEERRKAMQSLPGRWECATTFIQDFGKGDVSCSLKYELVFRDDGRWTEKRISDNSETTYNGQWSLAGNVLTLRYDEDAVTVSYIQSKKYVHNFTVPYYEKPQKFIVYWRNDGAFELRRDINDLMNNHPDTIAHYDANGTYHQRAKWRRLFFSGETVLSETAKIFRRVSY